MSAAPANATGQRTPLPGSTAPLPEPLRPFSLATVAVGLGIVGLSWAVLRRQRAPRQHLRQRERDLARTNARLVADMAACQARIAAAVSQTLVYEQLVQNVGDYGIFMIDPQGNIASWNEGARRLKGYTAEEILGQPYARFFTPEDLEADKPQRLLHAAIETGRAQDQGWRVCKDGTRFWADIVLTAVRDPAGKVVGIAKIVRDITAERQAGEALRETQSRLRAMLAAMPDPIVVVDRQGDIVRVNDQAVRIFGHDLEDMLGHPIEMLVPARFRDVHRVHRGQFFAFPHSRAMGQGLELYALRKDGSEFPVEISLSPVDTTDGLFVIAAIRDITERKRDMAELALRSIELKQAEELGHLKDHFLSTMSHEMKTPLSLIMGYAELLDEKYPREDFIAGIEDGARRLTEHINNILDYSALISRSLPLHLGPVDLAELVTHIRETNEAGLVLEHLALVTEVQPDLPSVRCDDRRVVQMLQELMANARKFTPAGGQVGIRVSRSTDDVRIDVWDTGTGIAEEDLDRIWGAFTQLETGDALRRGGLGLGLSIVKLLVDLHRGRVEVWSQEGHGSTFSIYLPIAGPAPAATPRITMLPAEAQRSAPRPLDA